MEIRDILPTQAVIADLRATSKRQAIQALAHHLAEIAGLSEREVFDVLIERERLGTTGVGNGIAIPHGKLPTIDRLFGVFARLEQPIEFDAVDGQPVDLIFLLLAPEAAGAEHLKALARVSRLLRDREVTKRLRAENNRALLHAILTAESASKAA